ncbi:hypothetical protein RN001_012544, partial [Aquatica leii]
MAPVLLFLATHVALAINSNRYNVTEISTKLKHVNYFQNETSRAMIPSYSNKGTINNNTNNYEAVHNANTSRWSTPLTFKDNSKVLTNSLNTKPTDKVNLETTRSSNSNFNYDYIKHNFRTTLDTSKFSSYDLNPTQTTIYAQNAKNKEKIYTRNVFIENESNQKRDNVTLSSNDGTNHSRGLHVLNNIIPFKNVTKFKTNVFFNISTTNFYGTKLETTSDFSITTKKINTYQMNRFKKALTNKLVTPATIKQDTIFFKNATLRNFYVQEEKNSTLLNTDIPTLLSTQEAYQPSSYKITVADEQRTSTRQHATVHSKETTNSFNFFTTLAPDINVKNQNLQNKLNIIKDQKTVPSRIPPVSKNAVSSTTFSISLLNKQYNNDSFLNNDFTTPKNINLLNCSTCLNVSITNLTNLNFENKFTINVEPNVVTDSYAQDLEDSITLSSRISSDNVLDNYSDVLRTTSATFLTEVFENTEFVKSIFVENFSDVPVKLTAEFPWPVKKEAVVEGDLVLGGLMMVHEREDTITCGPIMPQGGIQALEAMLYTLDRLNEASPSLLPNISLGAHILDDCDKDTYGLEMAVDFIKAVTPNAANFSPNDESVEYNLFLAFSNNKPSALSWSTKLSNLQKKIQSLKDEKLYEPKDQNIFDHNAATISNLKED